MKLRSKRLLEGKNAIVTGCLKGIGHETMDFFAECGANVWACCQHENEDFLAHINDLQVKNGVVITPVYFDLSDYESIKAAVRTIASKKTPVDVLVNIAGMTQDALFQMIPMDQMKKIFEINFFSQMLLTQYISKLMLRNKKGSIINIASITGIDGNPGQLSYSASKAAIIASTKTLSSEIASLGIRVNAVAPGVIKTEMTDNLPSDAFSRLMDRCSLKRIGKPSEVASVIAFLASDLSTYVTGQVIRIDGGIG